MRFRSTVSARSRSRLGSAETCFDWSSSRARCMPPWRSSPRLSGTRVTVGVAHDAVWRRARARSTFARERGRRSRRSGAATIRIGGSEWKRTSSSTLRRGVTRLGAGRPPASTASARRRSRSNCCLQLPRPRRSAPRRAAAPPTRSAPTRRTGRRRSRRGAPRACAGRPAKVGLGPWFIIPPARPPRHSTRTA